MKKILVLVELGFDDNVVDITYEDVLGALNNFSGKDDKIVMWKRWENEYKTSIQ